MYFFHIFLAVIGTHDLSSLFMFSERTTSNHLRTLRIRNGCILFYYYFYFLLDFIFYRNLFSHDLTQISDLLQESVDFNT